ncbi:MAG: phosphoribosylglycinamide formyltransferase [Planctomycetota bacterium]
MPLKLGVLLSGSGTTLENLFERIERGKLDAAVTVVVGSKRSAFGLERARKRGVPAEVVRPKDHDYPAGFSDRITAILDRHEVDLVVLAGFMFLYRVPDRYAGRVMNVHPALIPAFCGQGFYGHLVHEAVLARGAKLTGCTVHFVDNAYDNGPIILQQAVPVTDDDTPDSLAMRVQAAEREAYPEAIGLYAAGRLVIEGRRVRIRPA